MTVEEMKAALLAKFPQAFVVPIGTGVPGNEATVVIPLGYGIGHSSASAANRAWQNAYNYMKEME